MLKVKHIYKNYATYLKHQASKLNKNEKWIKEYDGKYEKVLTERLERYDLEGKKVLCLGSRLGGEVKAFINNGALAIGIDLNPGKNNKYVVYGDFHHIQYKERTFDYIFINCLDHTYNIDKLIISMYRLLDYTGKLIVEVNNGIQEGFIFKQYESLQWDYIHDVENRLSTYFDKVYSFRIDFPFSGKHILFNVGE